MPIPDSPNVNAAAQRRVPDSCCNTLTPSECQINVYTLWFCQEDSKSQLANSKCTSFIGLLTSLSR